MNLFLSGRMDKVAYKCLWTWFLQVCDDQIRLSREYWKDHQQLATRLEIVLFFLQRRWLTEAIRKAIQIFQCQLGSDSRITINTITGHCQTLNLIRNLVDDIRNLLTCIRNTQFIYFTRKKTEFVDSLARKAHVCISLLSINKILLVFPRKTVSIWKSDFFGYLAATLKNYAFFFFWRKKKIFLLQSA